MLFVFRLDHISYVGAIVMTELQLRTKAAPATLPLGSHSLLSPVSLLPEDTPDPQTPNYKVRKAWVLGFLGIWFLGLCDKEIVQELEKWFLRGHLSSK